MMENGEWRSSSGEQTMIENGEWNGQEQRKRKTDLGEDKEGEVTASWVVKGNFWRSARMRLPTVSI
jgi:hypothetical protein